MVLAASLAVRLLLLAFHLLRLARSPFLLETGRPRSGEQLEAGKRSVWPVHPYGCSLSPA